MLSLPYFCDTSWFGSTTHRLFHRTSDSFSSLFRFFFFSSFMPVLSSRFYVVYQKRASVSNLFAPSHFWSRCSAMPKKKKKEEELTGNYIQLESSLWLPYPFQPMERRHIDTCFRINTCWYGHMVSRWISILLAMALLICMNDFWKLNCQNNQAPL